MAEAVEERRIWMIVGGKFTPDSIGPDEYRRVVETVRASPAAHIRAFRRLFMTGTPDADRLTDLHLTAFLKLVAPVARSEVRQMAALIANRMARLSRAHESEADESDSQERIDELARRQRRIAVHRSNLTQLAR